MLEHSMELKNKFVEKDVVGVVKYIEDKLVIKVNDSRYKRLYYEIDADITKFKTLYSLPANDKHEAWTKRKIAKVSSSANVGLYWTPFKPEMKVTGRIVQDKFIITKYTSK